MPVIPANMIPPPALTSQSQFIVSRRYRQFLPDSGVGPYSYASNNRVQITLNSPSEFLSGADSWLEFDLAVTLNDTDATTRAGLVRKYLDCGGSHTIFNNFRIQASNGTIFEDIQQYNKLYSIMSRYTVSADHIRYVEGPLSGDSVNKQYEFNETLSSNNLDPGATMAYVNGATTISYPNLSPKGTIFQDDVLRVGDKLLIKAVGNATLDYRTVTAIDVTGQIFTINAALTIGANANIDFIQNLSRAPQYTIQSSRRLAANSTSVFKCKIKPFSNLLNNHQLFPLAFCKNLQLVFSLERPEFVVCSPLPPSGPATMTANYTISNVKYMACMINPSDEILESYTNLYNSEEGIKIPFISYIHSLRNLPNGNLGSWTIPVNARSARAVITALYSRHSEEVDQYCYAYDSISTTLKNGVSEYVYRAGGESFPSFGRYNVETEFNNEMLQAALLAMDSAGNTLHDVSFKPTDFYAINNLTLTPAIGGGENRTMESFKAIFAARLSRGDAYTGIDLLNSDLIVEFQQVGPGSSGPSTTPIYARSFIIHDRVLSVSRLGSIVQY